MIKYFYNPLDRMVVCSDGRTFTVASDGSLVKTYAEIEEFISANK